jgi:hypothetical protein
MSAELLRIVDGLARDKSIDKQLVLDDLVLAMETAIRKKYAEVEDVMVSIDQIISGRSRPFPKQLPQLSLDRNRPDLIAQRRQM